MYAYNISFLQEIYRQLSDIIKKRLTRWSDNKQRIIYNEIKKYNSVFCLEALCLLTLNILGVKENGICREQFFQAVPWTLFSKLTLYMPYQGPPQLKETILGLCHLWFTSTHKWINSTASKGEEKRFQCSLQFSDRKLLVAPESPVQSMNSFWSSEILSF